MGLCKKRLGPYLAAVAAPFLFFSVPAYADTTDAAEAVTEETGVETLSADFVSTFTQDVSALLMDDATTDEEKTESLKALLQDRMAIDYLARLLIGTARKDATEDQLESYYAVFPSYISNIYASQLKRLGERQFTVQRVVQTRPREIIVRTDFVVENQPKPITVDWRLRIARDKSSVALVDAAVKGVSTVLVEKDNFSTVIKNEGFDGFVALLEEKSVEKLEAATFDDEG